MPSCSSVLFYEHKGLPCFRSKSLFMRHTSVQDTLKQFLRYLVRTRDTESKQTTQIKRYMYFEVLQKKKYSAHFTKSSDGGWKKSVLTPLPLSLSRMQLMTAKFVLYILR